MTLGVPDRREESRNILINMAMMSIGSYTEQESKKMDKWRDEPFDKVYAHWRHEVQEIENNLKRKDPMTYLVHNGMDMVSLSCILLARIMETTKKND